MINGVIAQKLQHLDTILTELRSLGCLTVQDLEMDWRTKRAVERSLQILVEIVIDVCQRILSRLVNFESFRNEILAYLKRTHHEN
jgi:uncharacterized protein YutE (UPF0331/DUF86 family)